MVYLLDIYNEYDKNANVKEIFTLFGRVYCIREVDFEWGRPKFKELRFDDEPYTDTWHYYDTFEDALKAVKALKEGERKC